MRDMLFLTYPHAHGVRHNFAWSLMSTVRHFERHGIRELIVHPERCYAGDDLAEGRNRQVKAFLASDADWFFTVDTDVGWNPEQIENLIREAEDNAISVVSGLYRVSFESGDDGMGGVAVTTSVPAAWRWTQGGMQSYWHLPENGLTQVDAVGAGLLLVHRTVMEAVKKEFGEHWFSIRPAYAGEGNMGEDVSFCRRLWDLSIPIHLHTGVVAKHNKSAWI